MKKFNTFKEEIANVTGRAVAGTGDDSSTVVVRRSGKRKLFTYNVEPKLFDMFRRGKKKYEKWAKYLDLEDEAQADIYKTAMKNPKGIIKFPIEKLEKSQRTRRQPLKSLGETHPEFP